MMLPTLLNLAAAAALSTPSMAVLAAGPGAAADAAMSCAQISAELKRLAGNGTVASDVQRAPVSTAPTLMAGPGAAPAARPTTQPVRNAPQTQADLMRQEHLMGLSLARNCK